DWAKKVKEVFEPAKPPKPQRAPIDLISASAADRYDYFKQVVTETMKGTWEDGDKKINVVGVRNFREWLEIGEKDFHWNDSIYVIWKEGDKKKIEGFLASVDPAANNTK